MKFVTAILFLFSLQSFAQIIPFAFLKTQGCQAYTTSTAFTAAGSATFTIPSGVRCVTIKAWGGGGGSGSGTGALTTGGSGGGGGFAQVTVRVNASNVLDVKVGGSRIHSAVLYAGTYYLVAGGGGNGGSYGNGSTVGSGGNGGAGGGLQGSAGNAGTSGNEGGAGGTDTAGGAGGVGCCNVRDDGYPGDYMTGGLSSSSNAGSGGSGYYGGGGGGYGKNEIDASARAGGGGGGGSSFTCAFSICSNGLKTAGSGTSPGNNGDANYASPAGVGATGGAGAGAAGNNGRVVILY
jgi:hypothetical protein